MHFDQSPNPNPPESGLPGSEVCWTVSTESPEPVTWAVWPPGIVTIAPSADGRSASLRTTGAYGTATVRASQGGESIAQFVWVGFLLRYSKSRNELCAMESHDAARISAKGRTKTAVLWSPAGECFVLNDLFLRGDEPRSKDPLYWIANGRPQPGDNDPVYAGDYGKGTFFAPGGGQLWSEFGPKWATLDPKDPAVKPVLDEMNQLQALVAWAPPANAPVFEHEATASVVTCYILNIDLLEGAVDHCRGQVQEIPVKKVD